MPVGTTPNIRSSAPLTRRHNGGHNGGQTQQGCDPVQLLFSSRSVVFLAFFHSWEDGDTRYEHASHASLLDIHVPYQKKSISARIPHLQQQNAKNLWADDPNLPDWMENYFSWHAQQLSLVTQSNWKSDNRRYLLLQCYQQDNRCGGVFSDRIKPLPLVLLAAYRSQRLVFIDWSVPHRLEEFLVPPVGGLNWTAPEWMRHACSQEDRKLCTRAGQLLEMTNTTATLMQTQWNSFWLWSDSFSRLSSSAFNSCRRQCFPLFVDWPLLVNKLLELEPLSIRSEF